MRHGYCRYGIIYFHLPPVLSKSFMFCGLCETVATKEGAAGCVRTAKDEGGAMALTEEFVTFFADV